jgi:hypothetical protein
MVKATTTSAPQAGPDLVDGQLRNATGADHCAQGGGQHHRNEGRRLDPDDRDENKGLSDDRETEADVKGPRDDPVIDKLGELVEGCHRGEAPDAECIEESSHETGSGQRQPGRGYIFLPRFLNIFKEDHGKNDRRDSDDTQ